MRPYFRERFGNPGALHAFGQEAIGAVDASRETIAKAIGAEFGEIIFTGSATEANNLVLRGVVKHAIQKISKGDVVASEVYARIHPNDPKRYSDWIPKVIVSAIEHESILETARDLEKEGVEVVVVPVDEHGVLHPEEVQAALDERTVLVSVMYVNNEIGTIQPIQTISEIIRNFREEREERIASSTDRPSPLTSHYPLFHTDAVQAFQFLDCDVEKLGVDMMTLSAHKIYGPKGIGALYVRHLAPDTRQLVGKKNIREARGHLLDAITTGGGQEFGLRSGTEDVPSSVGFARAIALAHKHRTQEMRRVFGLRDYFLGKLKKLYPNLAVNGPLGVSGVLPNIVNVYFLGHRAEALLVKFDLAGLAASSGSACRARSLTPSHVLKELGYADERIRGSIRFSFGRPTTRREVDKAIQIIKISLRR